jgi:hypothetical protein
VTRLEDQDPPHETSPGYYPDPLRGEYQRWWDGTAWTARVGPKAGRAPDKHKSVWWGIGRYASFATTTVLLLVLHGNVLTDVAIAVGAGLAVDAMVRFFFWLNPDRRPDPSGSPDS